MVTNRHSPQTNRQPLAMTATSMPMPGRRRRTSSSTGCRRAVSFNCCITLALLAARAPSKLLAEALLLNSNLVGGVTTTAGSGPPSSAYGMSRRASSWPWCHDGGGRGSSAAVRMSLLSGMPAGDERRGERSRLPPLRRRRGAGASARSNTALAAAAGSSSSSGSSSGSRDAAGGASGGGDEEGRVWGVWAVQDEEEWEFEEEVQRLEERLEEAVKREDYKGAAKCRDELYRIHMDETSAVLSTNSAFYAAFTAKDADRMESLWMPSNDVMCIHPGDEPVLGQQAVARSWRSLFRSGDSRLSSSVIKPTEVRIRVRGTTAVVQCNEEVTTRLTPSPSSSSSSSKSDGGSSSSPPSQKKDAAAWLAHVIADSPYEPGSDKAIVSNPTTPEDRARIKKAVGKHGAANIRKAVDTAFAQNEKRRGSGGSTRKKKGGGGGGVGGKRRKAKPRTLNVTNIYRKAGGRWLMVHHHASLPPPAQSSSERRAAMGIDGLKDGLEGMTRIINLSDQGGGGFGGGGGKDNKLEEMLEALRNRLPGGLPGGLGGTGSGRTPSSGMIIIGDTDDDDDDEDDDEDEDEDEDDDEEDEDDDDEDDDEDGDHIDVTSSSSSVEEESGGSRWGREERPPSEDLTKKTIESLRTLVEIKLLGKDEQRRLMADVIQHAAGSKASAVEVAYELLLAHSNEELEDSDSLAEFVDQCKMLASNLFHEDKKKKRWWRRRR